MSRAIFLAALALAGCATRPVDRSELQAQHTYALCYGVIAGNYRGAWLDAANDELVRRNETCQSHIPAISARLQNEASDRAAAAQAGLKMLQRPRQQQASPPPPRVCRSVVSGNTLNTICY